MSVTLGSFTSDLFHTVELMEVDSTNSYLKTELSEGRLRGPVLCWAHRQTAGYGQRGSEWVQSLNSVALSIAVPFENMVVDKPFISAEIALLLRQSISEASNASNLSVKWPNDVYLDGQKVAGCLIELLKISSVKKEFYLIIGVGVNCSPVSESGFDATYVNNLNFDNFLDSFSSLIYQFLLVQKIDRFSHSEWQSYDFFTPGREVIVYYNDSFETGHYVGLDESACALVDIKGQVNRYQSGIVSIRPL